MREVAAKAWALLVKDNIRGHLVGTAALVALGYGVPCEDVDFLCESMPTCGESLPPDPEYRDGEASREMNIDGVDVNFILAGDARAPFLAPEPVWVDGVPVAPLLYVLNLKARANRKKDHAFFDKYPEFARMLSAQSDLGHITFGALQPDIDDLLA